MPTVWECLVNLGHAPIPLPDRQLVLASEDLGPAPRLLPSDVAVWLIGPAG